MSRYIDADKLKQHYAYWESSKYDYMQEEKKLFDNIVDQQPTADAVEVIRCDQCRHFEAINNDDHGWCKLISDLPCEMNVRYDDDYCSYGERAEA